MQSLGRKQKTGRVLKAMLLAAVAFAVLLMTVSVLISEEVLAMEAGGIFAVICLAVSSLIGSAAMVKRGQERRMQNALLFMAAYFLLMLLIAPAFAQGKLAGGQLVILLIAIGIGAITGCILTIYYPKRSRRR